MYLLTKVRQLINWIVNLIGDILEDIGQDGLIIM